MDQYLIGCRFSVGFTILAHILPLAVGPRAVLDTGRFEGRQPRYLRHNQENAGHRQGEGRDSA